VSVPLGCRCTDDLCLDLWKVCNAFFMAVFTVELMLHLWIEGVCGFFCESEGIAWNWMDFIIVASGYLSIFAIGSSVVEFRSPCHASLPKLSNTIFLGRVARFVRIVRIFRRRSFPQLSLIVRGMVESFPQVTTVMVLLLLLVFIVAILTTILIGQEAALWDDDEGDEAEIKKYFGKVLPSMFTLFQFMTLDDWAYVCDLVSKKMPILAVSLFDPFIVVVGFVMLSLFSGVWVDHMVAMRQQETKEQQLQAIQEAEETNKTFQTIFGAPDDSPMACTNAIDEEEFVDLLSKPAYREAAAANDLSVSRAEAKELFAFWDVSNDKRMNWKEFRTGLEEYREGLTVKKVLLMKSHLRSLAREFEGDGGKRLLANTLPVRSPEVAGQVAQVEVRLREMEGRLVQFEDTVKQAQRLCGSSPGGCSPFSACSGGKP